MGEYASCIQAKDIANIGVWTTFYPRDLEKLQLKLIEKPNPDISMSSIPKNPWTILLSNDTDIRIKRLKNENIKEQLETHGILKDININRKELVKELELALAKENLEKTLASKNLECSSISSLSNHIQNLPENEKSDADSNVRYPLASGWALKSSQKYEKEGCGKRISKKVWNFLKGYFLKSNINKSERHTAESMLTQLKQCVENGIIEKNEVPKLETIQNWISCYASQHRQEAAEIIARVREKA
ncbi:hypothetical protein C2G38_2049963 [Gigaspora rosea]|uniref:Uncharacterized protein n=1 Tax=Gigaspora rosea TaxID=44941 RepID=A0A397U596_9GLOM|nr:hypothetical protein C2G38_2049963 [Gigaspora rosea]